MRVWICDIVHVVIDGGRERGIEVLRKIGWKEYKLRE